MFSVNGKSLIFILGGNSFEQVRAAHVMTLRDANGHAGHTIKTLCASWLMLSVC